MQTFRTAALLWLLLLATPVPAQLVINADYTASSSFKDNDGNRLGDGSIALLSAAYAQPLSLHLNERHQPTLWMGTLSAKYAILDNSGAAQDYSPDHILNTGLNIIHVRPIGERWSLMAMLGAGLYADPSDVSLNCLQANGGAVFIYKVSDRLDLGIGAALTNAYGAPAALPMLYVKYQTTGAYELDFSMVGGLKLGIKRRWTETFATNLMAFDMDGLSAVTKVDGKWKVYSTMLMRSMLMAEWTPAEGVRIYGGAGYTWRRTSRLASRSFKNFYKMFSDDDRMHYAPAPTFRLGASVKF